MMTPGHIVSMYVTTSGLSGPQLGSDEKEIILLVYAVIDPASSKVVDLQQYLVRPVGEFGTTATVPAIAASATSSVSSNNNNNNHSITNTNTTTSSNSSLAGDHPRDTASPTHSTASDSTALIAAGHNLPGSASPSTGESGAVPAPAVPALPEHNITEAMLKLAGRPLGECIEQFDQHLRTTLAIDPDAANFRLVTDGALPLRQCLHPEACSKNLQLPAYYCRYNDLRKEFVRFRSADLSRALVAVKDLKNLASMPALPAPPASIAEMMQLLDLQSPSEIDPNYFANDSRDMITLVQHMITAGHKFDAVESINITLEPGLCSIDDEIDGQCIVRARGLPWQSSDQDIANFFRGLNVAKGGVALCLSVQGRRNGEAMVRFASQEHRDMALKRHKHHIGNRYIEVYRASGEDFLNVAGGASNEAQTFLSRGAQVIIRMRGLPYDCTAKQVLDFFANGNEPCTVLDATEGILFVKKPDGRATGDAFVLFAQETDAPKALSRHRESIGQRYIELFRSTTAEVQQVLNRSMDPKTYEPAPPPLIAQLPPVQMPLLPQHVITSGTAKSCIRLRGLPYEARVEHILHFLEDFANNIIYQGVHMVYNAQGQPSGEAFIQMDSEEAARASAQLKHNKYMVFGKKYRYIEVFQCSGDDMNLVLNGGLHSPANATKPALLSPGGTMLASSFAGFGPYPSAGPAAVLHQTRGPPHHPHHHPTHHHPHHPAAAAAFYPQPILYWGYPSPPVSPTAYYGPPPTAAGTAVAGSAAAAAHVSPHQPAHHGHPAAAHHLHAHHAVGSAHAHAHMHSPHHHHPHPAAALPPTVVPQLHHATMHHQPQHHHSHHLHHQHHQQQQQHQQQQPRYLLPATPSPSAVAQHVATTSTSPRRRQHQPLASPQQLSPYLSAAQHLSFSAPTSPQLSPAPLQHHPHHHHHHHLSQQQHQQQHNAHHNINAPHPHHMLQPMPLNGGGALNGGSPMLATTTPVALAAAPAAPITPLMATSMNGDTVSAQSTPSPTPPPPPTAPQPQTPPSTMLCTSVVCAAAAATAVAVQTVRMPQHHRNGTVETPRPNQYVELFIV